MQPAAFDYHAPASLADAAALLAQSNGDARIVAGGQSLLAAMNLRVARPSALIDLRAIPGLDAIDIAPTQGWSPTGAVELLVGHCYVVWTRDDHYAKFRVTQITPPGPSTPARVQFDWAYQVDPGNVELRNRPVRPKGPRAPAWPGA